MSASFVASESRKPNIRHEQIRAAINIGAKFTPGNLRNFYEFEMQTEDYKGIGRLSQSLDGYWWAWLRAGITGHRFSGRQDACKYLERVSDRIQVFN
jgi:hypothetical protein